MPSYCAALTHRIRSWLCDRHLTKPQAGCRASRINNYQSQLWCGLVPHFVPMSGQPQGTDKDTRDKPCTCVCESVFHRQMCRIYSTLDAACRTWSTQVQPVANHKHEVPGVLDITLPCWSITLGCWCDPGVLAGHTSLLAGHTSLLVHRVRVGQSVPSQPLLLLRHAACPADHKVALLGTVRRAQAVRGV